MFYRGLLPLTSCPTCRYLRSNTERLFLAICLLLAALNVTLWSVTQPHTRRSYPPASSSLSIPLPPPEPAFHGTHSDTCTALLAESPINETHLQLLRERYRRAVEDPGAERLRELVKDCAALKREHGYLGWPVTRQEEEFPLAFSFKMHQNPEFFERLLSAVWRPHNLYVIHVDSKAPDHVFKVMTVETVTEMH